ncbi:hypothetical protein BO79DRAFT_257553 [Aspergillus costaricaensis CBS 115574]|uniref:Uncharacterized protein n=1 Tax=Aspergillus costaricaensis CBS 115574 TaxID=1448317 RepID=A0ACD1I9D9_9EURO|nr:hypothetical protein BO79DRAFT_257553 [Aspergillus costaricaensis CBS 115574]RAK86389.1 hypothetical protein BO79DRAFT_257553 [Aspergillus costaricaensis CBS 115574]
MVVPPRYDCSESFKVHPGVTIAARRRAKRAFGWVAKRQRLRRHAEATISDRGARGLGCETLSVLWIFPKASNLQGVVGLAPTHPSPIHRNTNAARRARSLMPTADNGRYRALDSHWFKLCFSEASNRNRKASATPYRLAALRPSYMSPDAARNGNDRNDIVLLF